MVHRAPADATSTADIRRLPIDILRLPADIRRLPMDDLRPPASSFPGETSSSRSGWNFSLILLASELDDD